MNRSTATRVGIAALATAAVAGLSACGSSSSDPSANISKSPTMSPPTSAMPTPTAVASTAAPSPVATVTDAGGQSVSVMKTATDPDLGDSVTLETYVPNVPIPAAVIAKHAGYQGKHFVFIKVKMKAGSKVYGGMTDTIELTASGVSYGMEAEDSTFLSDVVAAAKQLGYPLTTVPKNSGGSASGWLMFMLNDDATDVKIALKRGAMTITDYGLGGNGTHDNQLPAKSFPLYG